MFFRKKSSIETLHTGVDSFNRRTRVIHVHKGSGLLAKRYIREPFPDAYFDRKIPYGSTYEWQFRGQALVHINEAACETTRSMLMYGQGRKVLDQYFDVLNTNTYFDEALSNLNPVLSLLESGYYTITEKLTLPTNGADAFFWDVKNSPITPITSSCYAHLPSGVEYRDLGTNYLYPSQKSTKYNEERVAHYLKFYQEVGAMPYVLTLALPGHLSLCFDGHHKAAACAHLGITVPTLEIEQIKIYKSNGFKISVNSQSIPVPRKYQYPLSQVEGTPFLRGEFNTRDWSDYQAYLHAYPSYLESFLQANLDFEGFSQKHFEDALSKGDLDMLHYFIMYVNRTAPEQIKAVSMAILDQNIPDYALNAFVLKTLVNSNVEDLKTLLIDCILRFENEPSLKKVIYAYWE